jgi:hypothetical protein
MDDWSDNIPLAPGGLKRQATTKGYTNLRVKSARLVPSSSATPICLSLRPRLIGLGLALLLMLLDAGRPSVEPASAHFGLPDDLSYNTETTWVLPSLPNLSATAGYIPHNFAQGEATFRLDDEVIHGFRPGKDYKEMYVRDIAWGMETAQYYYPGSYLREPIEAFLRRQYTADSRSLDGDFGVLAGEGAIPGIITAEGKSDKETITSDEETSLIHAAYLYYKITGNAALLKQPVGGRPIIDRLNLAADWLYSRRLNAELQLLWRGHTTDWGDVKFEASTNYTDYDPKQDHLTASIYDQVMAYLAWSELAEMNAAIGTPQAALWRERAEAIKQQANLRLWQPGRGYYLTHLHITPLDHPFDEAAMVSISNALAVYAGLADPEQSRAILENLERVRLEAGASKPGLSIYPYYPNQWPNLFFDYLGMGYGNYQNGGVWDWWGGVQIKTEFLKGFAERGTAHLLQVANDWHAHPGNILEWESTTDPDRHVGSSYYSAAAGTMGSAIIEGFFGIRLDASGLTLQPRLGLNDGFIRVYQSATDRYAAYRYDWDQAIIKLDYGTNVPGPAAIKVLQLQPQPPVGVTLDGQPVEFSVETVGSDRYVVLSAPSGQHSVEIVKGSAIVEPATPPTALDDSPSVSQQALPAETPTAPPAAIESPGELGAQKGGATQAPGGSDAPGLPLTPAADWAIRPEIVQSAGTGLVLLSSVGLIGLILNRSRRR